MLMSAAILNEEEAPIAKDFVYSLLIVGGASALAAGFLIIKNNQAAAQKFEKGRTEFKSGSEKVFQNFNAELIATYKASNFDNTLNKYKLQQ